MIAASVLVPGDYLAINTMLSADALAAMGFPTARIQELSQLVEVDVAGRPGGAVSLAVGMASIFAALPGMAGLMAYWYQFALVFEALFILTTIDTGTRVARYLIQEMAGRLYAPFRRMTWWPGVSVSSGFVVGAWAYLDRHRKHLDHLADVRRGQSVAWDACALYRDDGADQDAEVAVSLGHGGADAVRRRHYADRLV